MDILRKWWLEMSDWEEDACDMAPLDCTSGSEGLWKFIVALWTVLFSTTGDPREADFSTDWDPEQRLGLSSLTELVSEVCLKLTQLYALGSFKNTSLKRKSRDTEGEPVGRVTRARGKEIERKKQIKKRKNASRR
ncbi:hypothetical protein D9758_012920 [Tetrapyrgos nigripes]|uniref:Uncharacterized protein n=1 Tax=Tetrapyrgos nigripes TaxID=182062 RepID=A0A8H5CN90_9AGAR|nr:hypothetical protein D9758_012920 [Tetrapyrgos nigripes]